MREILCLVGVASIEVEAVRLELRNRNAPRHVALDAILASRAAPPLLARRELLEAHRPRLRILLTTLRRRDLIEPDLPRPSRLLEEHEVGWDVRVWRKGSIREPHNRVHVALSQETLFYPRRSTVPKEEAVRHDHPAPSARLEDSLDELNEEQSGLGGPRSLGEVGLDRFLLLSPERRVFQHNVDAITRADLSDRMGESVVAHDRRLLDPMEREIHHPE